MPGCWPIRWPKGAPTGRRSTSAISRAERISPIASAGCAFRAWPGRGTTRGFFYSRYPEPPAGKTYEAALSGHALYYHRIGTPQSEDELIFARPDLPTWFVHGTVSEDGQYLLIALFEGATNSNRLYVADLGEPASPDVRAPIRAVVETDGAEYAPIGVERGTLFVRSDAAAPNRCVLALDLGPTTTGWRVVVPERPHRLGAVVLAGGRLVAESLVDVQSRIDTPRSLDRRPPRAARAARAGRGDRAGWTQRRSRRVADVHVAAPPGHGLSSGPRHQPPVGVRTGVSPGRSLPLRDPPDVRVLPGRHQGAVLRHRPGDAAARRRHARDDVRLRRILGGYCCRPTGRTCRRGSSAAACGSP